MRFSVSKALRGRISANRIRHNPLGALVDHDLTYGRHVIGEFLGIAMPYRVVVDVGAGTGRDLETARALGPDARLIAVDAHPDFVKALDTIADEVRAVDIEHEALPVDAETVDVIIANQVLEHTKELFWIFHQMTRSLRVGGSLIIGVPNLAAFHNRVILAVGRQPTSIKSASAHIRGFTRTDLLRFTEYCFPGGYQCVGYRGSQFYPFRGTMARTAARIAPGLAGSLFLALRKERHYDDEFLAFPKDLSLETNFFLGH